MSTSSLRAVPASDDACAGAAGKSGSSMHALYWFLIEEGLIEVRNFYYWFMIPTLSIDLQVINSLRSLNIAAVGVFKRSLDSVLPPSFHRGSWC